MMVTIVNEDKITFKELEQKIFHYVCDLAVNITEIMLESYDRELHGQTFPVIVDVINMHVPMRDAVCTAGRRAMLQFCL